MTFMRKLVCGLVALSVISPLAAAQSGDDGAGTVVAVTSFRSVELRSGVKATIRYGPTHRVTFLSGDPADARVRSAGDELIIEKRRSKSGRRYELDIEIVTPELARITVAHGGVTQSRGSFPRQIAIDVNVDNGGTIDIRSMAVESVTASVVSGGTILAKPLTALVASVERGGNITYWGDVPVTQSVDHAGVVIRGLPAEADKPLSEVSLGVDHGLPITPRRPVRDLRAPRP